MPLVEWKALSSVERQAHILESRDSGRVTRLDNSRQMAEAGKQVRPYSSMRRIRNGKLVVQILTRSRSQSQAVTTQSYGLPDRWHQRAKGALDIQGCSHVSLHRLEAPLLLQSLWLSCIPEISPPTGFLLAAGSWM